jgi:hypothetical protein
MARRHYHGSLHRSASPSRASAALVRATLRVYWEGLLVEGDGKGHGREGHDEDHQGDSSYPFLGTR